MKRLADLPHLAMVSVSALALASVPAQANAQDNSNDAGSDQDTEDAAERPNSTDPDRSAIVVLGDRRSEASSIQRSGLDPLDVPRAIQVIPRTILDDIRPETLEDALSLVSNVVFQGDSDGRENAFLIRGFQSATVLRDGFRVETFGGVADPELYNLESIEIIKGPSSVLFGESNPGGLVNMRAKRPRADNHAEIGFDYGTDGLISPRVDVGGPLGSDDVRFRFVGLYRSDDGWRDYDRRDARLFFAPSFHAAITDSTAVTFLAEITEDDFRADFGTAIDLAGELTAPIDQVNNHPQDRIDRFQRTVGLDIVQELSDEWHLTARGRHFDGGYEFSSLWLPISLDLPTLTYIQVALQQEQRNKEDAFQISLAGDTNVAGRDLNIVVGGDYRVSTINRSTALDATSLNFLNWANPDYSVPPPPAATLPFFAPLFAAEEVERSGVYGNTHFDLFEGLKVNLGGRYDQIDRTPLPGSTTAAQDVSDFSFQAGAIYDLSNSFSAFFSYSESFTPNFVTDRNNNLLDPERGEGFDFGIKGASADDLFSFTLSFFDITKTNVALPDPAAAITDPNPLGFIASAEQSSRGVDLDFNLALADGLSVFGGVGYADTNDNGERIIGAPEFTGNLQASYRVTSGALDGFTVGGGLRHVGSRVALADPNMDGNTADKVVVDGYTVFNAYVRYQVSERWQVQANASNLTDERYVQAALNNLSRSVYAGAPFEALISIRYGFD